MYNTERFYKTIETQVSEAGQFADIHNSYTEDQKPLAYANFYQTCASASTNPNNMQYVCAQIIEYSHDRSILLESRVFDYRQPEPAPEPEPEPEPENDAQEG